MNLRNLEFVTDHLSKQEETEGASEICETMEKMELETASSVVLTYFFLINLFLIHIFFYQRMQQKNLSQFRLLKKKRVRNHRFLCGTAPSVSD